MALISRKQLTKAIPNVGDVVVEKITTHGHPLNRTGEHIGVVTYVNQEHLWYQVEFSLEGYRVREGYKLPYIQEV